MKTKRRNRRKLASKSEGALVLAEVSGGVKKSVAEIGSSGTDIIGGFFREEDLTELQGQKAAQAYNKMRRRESQVAMLLTSIKNAIKQANFSFEIKDENDAEQIKMKQLCEWQLCKAMEEGKEQHISEVLTFLDYGFSIFEVLHDTKEVPGLGLVTYIKRFAYRKQETIYRWNLEKGTGKILSVDQQVTSDVSKESLVSIPGDFLVVFTVNKEGDNYEGISVLRPMYGPYLRKDLYLKIVAIGAEKYAIGIPIGEMPAGKVKAEEQARFEAMLEAYASNEAQYLVHPSGWKVTVQEGKFDPSKLVELLKYEDEQMVKAVVANFLALGTGGNGGAYALGDNLADFFYNVIKTYANLICDVWNRKVIPQLVRLNYGEKPSIPEMKVSGINDKAGEEFARILNMLISSQTIRPDDKLEEFLRKLFNLPKADPTTAREKPQPTFPGQNPNDPNAAPGEETEGEESEDAPPPPNEDEKSANLSEPKERRLVLAEKYKRDFERGKKEMRAVMEKHLREMADDLKEQLRRQWANKGENAIKHVAARGLSSYKSALREVMADIAEAALEQARKEVPAAKKVKFASFDKMNPKVKRAIERQLALVVETQAADLEKVVLFQFASSASSQTNIDGILNDVEARIQPILDGSSKGGMSLEAAAGDATAHIVQNTRNEFFFTPDVLREIESFTFVNDDPVSEICQNLNGQVFLPTDPAAEAYYPPLHHNCKSRIVPNLRGEKVPVTGLAPIADSLEERQRLEKLITLCDCAEHKVFS